MQYLDALTVTVNDMNSPVPEKILKKRGRYQDTPAVKGMLSGCAVTEIIFVTRITSSACVKLL